MNFLQETLDVEDGPEFVDDAGTAELRLVVRPIRDVFGIPKHICNSNKFKNE